MNVPGNKTHKSTILITHYIDNEGAAKVIENANDIVTVHVRLTGEKRKAPTNESNTNSRSAPKRRRCVVIDLTSSNDGSSKMIVTKTTTTTATPTSTSKIKTPAAAAKKRRRPSSAKEKKTSPIAKTTTPVTRKYPKRKTAQEKKDEEHDRKIALELETTWNSINTNTNTHQMPVFIQRVEQGQVQINDFTPTGHSSIITTEDGRVIQTVPFNGFSLNTILSPHSFTLDNSVYEQLSRLEPHNPITPISSKALVTSLVDVEWKETMDTKECPICLESYSKGEKIKMTECLHSFHKPCISEWFKVSKQCPICKHEHQ